MQAGHKALYLLPTITMIIFNQFLTNHS